MTAFDTISNKNKLKCNENETVHLNSKCTFPFILLSVEIFQNDQESCYSFTLQKFATKLDIFSSHSG